MSLMHLSLWPWFCR